MSLELPLVLFTILSQIAVGGYLTWGLMKIKTGLQSTKKEITCEYFIIYSLITLMLAGFVSSLSRLGRLENIYKSVYHIATSWVSREIIAFGIFFILLLAYVYFLKLERKGKKTGFAVEILIIAVGLLAVGIAGMAYYDLPSRPAWNYPSTIFFFYITTFLLGPLFIGVLFNLNKRCKKRLDLKVFLYKLLAVFGIAFTGLGGILWFFYKNYLFNSTPEALETANLIFIEFSSIFWLRMLLGFALPFLLSLGILYFGIQNKPNKADSLVYLSFICALIGEVLGRVLFFVTVVPMKVGFFGL